MTKIREYLTDESIGPVTKCNRLKIEEGLTVPQKHQLNVAKKTLKMSDAGARIIGGMTKEEARKFLKDVVGWSDAQISKLEK